MRYVISGHPVQACIQHSNQQKYTKNTDSWHSQGYCRQNSVAVQTEVQEDWAQTVCWTTECLSSKS